MAYWVGVLLAVALCGGWRAGLLPCRCGDQSWVPAWWPAFCLSFDAAAGGVLAGLLRGAIPAAERPLNR